MKKLITIFSVAAFAFFGLTACSTTPHNDDGDNVKIDYNAPKTSVFTQELPNGETVLCIWGKNGNGGGLSCNWDGLNSTKEGVE